MNISPINLDNDAQADIQRAIAFMLRSIKIAKLPTGANIQINVSGETKIVTITQLETVENCNNVLDIFDLRSVRTVTHFDECERCKDFKIVSCQLGDVEFRAFT
jgi:hypothetical protein